MQLNFVVVVVGLFFVFFLLVFLRGGGKPWIKREYEISGQELRNFITSSVRTQSNSFMYKK